MTAATMRTRKSPRPWHLALVITLGAVLLQLLALDADSPSVVSSAGWHWWAIAATFLAAEVCVVHVPFGRETHSFGLAEVPLVIGMFVLQPGDLVVARLLGGGLALVLVRRQPLEKLVFNLAQWWLTVVVALIVWQTLHGAGSYDRPRAWLAALAAVCVSELLATLLIVSAIGIREGHLPAGLLGRGVAEGQFVCLANTSFGLLAVHLLVSDWRNAWTLAVLAAVLYIATSSHVRLRQRHQSIRRIGEFTRDVGRSLDIDRTVEEVLQKSRTLLGAGRSLLTLEAGYGPGLPARTLTCTSEGVTESAIEAGDPSGPHVDEQRLTAVVEGPEGPIGLLTVCDPLGDVRRFSQDDSILLLTLARHAGSCLHNSRLAALLREEAAANEQRALHDPLTGLPNRTRFAQAISTACTEAPSAVLLLDLNRFKEVNDTLGHAAGDDLLREVARRLCAAEPDACVARLGGDEFGVLLNKADVTSAAACAERLRAALLAPLGMYGISFRVEASIGIALSPQHGVDADALLRCADVAMYYAKSNKIPSQVYTARCDVNTAARLALVSDLRWGLTNGQFRLQYQPKASISDGLVTSFEALIRWQDPHRGLVGPDAFIPVAEQVGLIGELTDWVLATSLADCKRWQAEGVTLSIAVNVSPATLHDSDFVQRVQRHLEEAEVDPHRLMLEITEGAVMRDPTHALLVLHELRDAGVRLSIDDLGAGQSSLTYLRQLPVHEVKIDKSFVMGMSEVPDDDAIVCALVNLVHTLRLPVVAEGVEDERTWRRLEEIGCDTAQGYWLSRPMDPEAVLGWLDSRQTYLDLENRTASGNQVVRLSAVRGARSRDRLPGS